MTRPFSFVLLLLLVSFFPSAPLVASSCKPGNPKNTAYMERNGDKRCEGITSPDIARPDFALRSFMVGQFATSNPLKLSIPRPANQTQPPNVRIQSAQSYYQLIPLSLRPIGSQWEFQ
jgi:hypothetical protein